MADYTEILAKTDFFADAPYDALERIAASGTERHLVRGDVLFSPGDPPEAIYLVLQGRIAIAIANELDRRERRRPDGGRRPDRRAGVLDSGPRSAMARAIEPSHVLAVPFEPVLDLYERDPWQLWNVTRMLAQRLRAADEAIADSVFLDVTGPHRQASARAQRLVPTSSSCR